MEKIDYFADYDIVGQERVRKYCTFLIDTYKRTGVMYPVMFTGVRGHGKSLFATVLAANLKDEKGLIKTFIEISGGSLRSVPSFVRDVIDKYVVGDKYVTLLIDEFQNVNREVMDWLLKVITISKNDTSTIFHNGLQYDFDMRKITIIVCTTNQEKVNKPLLDRFINRIEMEHYKTDELAEILKKNSPKIKYIDNLEYHIAEHARENPRNIVAISKHIGQWCLVNLQDYFNMENWNSLRESIHMNYLGLMSNEVRVLKYLEQHGPARPTLISSYLGTDLVTLTREIELFLFKKGLISSDGDRSLTAKGREALKHLN